jgi:hypothetical protein
MKRRIISYRRIAFTHLFKATRKVSSAYNGEQPIRDHIEIDSTLGRADYRPPPSQADLLADIHLGVHRPDSSFLFRRPSEHRRIEGGRDVQRGAHH